MKKQKLIIIRGNSGSGKSSVAERLREVIGGKTAIVGQDTLRRSILMEKDSLERKDTIGLLEQTVMYCLDKEYTVIVEGILSKRKYKDVLVKLMDYAQCDIYVFYIDVSLKETIRRHKTKPLASEVGEEQLRSWYLPKNHLDVPNEIVISEESTLEETVATILENI